MTKPELAYWNIRGFAEQIRLILRYMGVDFEDKTYNFTETPPEFGADAWFKEKFTHGLDFPNIPYWKDGEVKLTESKAILKYVARKYGKNLVPESAEDEARAEMVMGVANDAQRTLVNLAYERTSPHDKPIEESTAQLFENLAKFIGSKKFLFGDQIIYADFFVYEVLKQYKLFRPDFFKSQPILESYIERFEDLPQLSEYIKTLGGVKSYSPFAKLQF